MEGNSEDDNEELERLLRQRVADQEVIDRERELSPLRSGSAPPTTDQLFAFLGDGDVYEKWRSDPAYIPYYYESVKLNPRLPLPLPQKQDLHSTRSEIGDRKIMNNGGGESLFSMQPVFRQGKEELNMDETRKNEWKSNDLIGLPRLELRDRLKGIADVVQDEIAYVTSISRYPIRPASCAYEDTEYPGSHAAPHNVLPSLNTLYSNTNVHGNSSLQSIGSSVPQTYASSLDGSLSRNDISDLQIIAELPGLDAALSGLSQSLHLLADEGRHPTPLMQDEIDIQHKPHLQMSQNPINQYPFLNKNLKTPSPPFSIYDGSSPSHNIASTTSSLSNYWFNGCPNQEAGVEPRALGGGLTLRSNLLSAAELQNCYRVANHDSQNALPVTLVDPSYIQYLSEKAALNDLIKNRGSRGSSCIEFHDLQKAYFEALLLHYGLSSGKPCRPGKPCRLSNSFPGSPILFGGPVRRAEQYMHNSSGLRNTAGNFMGPWPSEPGTNLERHFTYLLDEFQDNKTRCFELGEIAGHVVEFSVDQYGSLFIQQKLETASTEEKNMVFHEIMPQALSLMTDVYGNYVIQKHYNILRYKRRENADGKTPSFITKSVVYRV